MSTTARGSGSARVVERGGRLWLGTETPLVAIGDNLWRVGQESWSPERASFADFVDGRPQTFIFSGEKFSEARSLGACRRRRAAKAPRMDVLEASRITPEIVAEHGLSPEEYERVLHALGPRAEPDRARHLLGHVVGALLATNARAST